MGIFNNDNNDKKDYTSVETHRFVCKKCGRKTMRPNLEGKFPSVHINGFKCTKCDTVNHPTYDSIIRSLCECH